MFQIYNQVFRWRFFSMAGNWQQVTKTQIGASAPRKPIEVLMQNQSQKRRRKSSTNVSGDPFLKVTFADLGKPNASLHGMVTERRWMDWTGFWLLWLTSLGSFHTLRRGNSHSRSWFCVGDFQAIPRVTHRAAFVTQKKLCLLFGKQASRVF